MLDSTRSSTIEALLRRWVLTCVSTAVVMAALVYPWRLPETIFAKLEMTPPGTDFWAWLYHDQFRSQLQFAHSTLVYKEAVAQAFLLAGLAGFFVLMMLRALREKETVRSRGVAPGFRNWIREPIAWALVLFTYLAVTLFGIGRAAEALLPGSPTFHYSLRTLFAFGLGMFAVLSIPALRVDRRWTVKFMAGLVLCGVLIAGIALLEHVGLAGFFLPASKDARNRMSSLIGHNTGMSSWLMFPLSFALYFSIASSRRVVAWFSRIAVALFLFVIVAAQSRAIWVLAAAITLVSLWSHFRVFHRALRGRSLAIGATIVLALIALQTVGPSWNPLARTPVPLFTRLKNDVLNLDQLRRETRLRIAVVSFEELIAKRPFTGTGFGSFQWVYPPAQGKYLREHLDTNLGYTRKRTDLAHNDYVQLLVEAGLIGFLLLAMPVFLLLRRGYIAFRNAGSPHDRALLIALALPLAAVSVHAQVDFPYHVVPTALAAAVTLGLWAASQGWLLKYATHDVEMTDESLDPAQTEATTRTGIRWKAVAGLAAAGSALFWVPLATRNLVYREFASDIFTKGGQNWLDGFQETLPSNLQFRKYSLDRALASFRNAIVLNVFNGAAYEGQSSAFSNRGGMFLTQARRYQSENSTSQAQTLLSAAEGDFEASIRSATNQIENGELRYHYTYHVIGNSYRGLWNLNPDVTNIRQFNYLKSAVTAYERAVDTNIADTSSLLVLSELLDANPLNDNAGAAKYRRLMFKVDPDAAYRMLLEPAVKSAELGDSAPAIQRLEHLQQSLPDEKRITAARALAYFYKAVWPPAELDREDTPLTASLAWRKEALQPTLPLLDGLAREPSVRDQAERLKLYYAAAGGDYARAVEIGESLAKRNPFDGEAMAVRDIAKEMTSAETINTSVERNYYRAKGLFGIYLGRDKRVAAMNLGSLAFETQLTLGEAARLLAFYKNNGWTELIKSVSPQALKYYPNEPAIVRAVGNIPATDRGK